MKKIISIIIILCMLLLLTSCYYGGPATDFDIYYADDFSYIMEHGVKYIKVDQTFTIYNHSSSSIIYTNQKHREIEIFSYSNVQVLKERQWLWWKYPSSDLYDVKLSDGINEFEIRFLDMHGSYCLPEDQETIGDIFKNITWSENKVIGKVEYPTTPAYFQFSDSLSHYLIETCTAFETEKELCVSRDSAIIIMVLYREDELGNFRQKFSEIIFKENGDVYAFPSDKIDLYYDWMEDESRINCTWEDLSSLKIPEEFHDEIMTLYNTYKDTIQ